MDNPYLELDAQELAGLWGMRAAELMPQGADVDAHANASRDTAYMMLAGAMRVAHLEMRPSFGRDSVAAQQRIRFEILKRAAHLAIPEHPERWLMDVQASGMGDLRRALDSDDGLCEALRHLQQIAWISGRWHRRSRPSNDTRAAAAGG